MINNQTPRNKIQTITNHRITNDPNNLFTADLAKPERFGYWNLVIGICLVIVSCVLYLNVTFCRTKVRLIRNLLLCLSLILLLFSSLRVATAEVPGEAGGESRPITVRGPEKKGIPEEVSWTPAERKEQIKTHYRMGREDYRNGDFALAIQEFNYVLTLKPEHKGANKYLTKAQVKREKRARKIAEAVSRERERLQAQQKWEEWDRRRAEEKAREEREEKARREEEQKVGEIAKRTAQVEAKLWAEEEAQWKAELKAEREEERVSREVEVERIAQEEKEERLEEKPEIDLSPRISMDLKDAEIDNVLRMLSEEYDLNIIVAEAVKGKVTIHFTEVTLEEALDAIVKVNGFDYIQRGSIIWVISPIVAEGRTRVTRLFTFSHADVSDIMKTLKEILTTDGYMAADVRTNSLVVRDIPPIIREIEGLIPQLDTESAQVMIEAKIVEVTVGVVSELGVKWLVLAETESATVGGTFNYKYFTTPLSEGAEQVGLSTLITGGSMVIGEAGDAFRGIINALITDNKARLMASPRLVVLDSETAEINITESFPYEKLSGFDANGNPIYTIEFLELGVSLKATPHIKRGKIIRLELEPEVSYQQGENIGIPIEVSRKTKTVVNVEDGKTLVIGGLISDKMSKTTHKVPFLGSIPLLGRLFRKDKRTINKTELLIFITPYIMTPETAARLTREAEERAKESEVAEKAGRKMIKRDWKVITGE